MTKRWSYEGSISIFRWKLEYSLQRRRMEIFSKSSNTTTSRNTIPSNPAKHTKNHPKGRMNCRNWIQGSSSWRCSWTSTRNLQWWESSCKWHYWVGGVSHNCLRKKRKKKIIAERRNEVSIHTVKPTSENSCDGESALSICECVLGVRVIISQTITST